MSKSTMAKTKTEKGGKGSNVPTPAVAHEIVTGKFTDQDWCVFSILSHRAYNRAYTRMRCLQTISLWQSFLLPVAINNGCSNCIIINDAMPYRPCDTAYASPPMPRPSPRLV